MTLSGFYLHCLRIVNSYNIVGKCFYSDLSCRFDTVVNIFNEETRAIRRGDCWASSSILQEDILRYIKQLYIIKIKSGYEDFLRYVMRWWSFCCCTKCRWLSVNSNNNYKNMQQHDYTWFLMFTVNICIRKTFLRKKLRQSVLNQAVRMKMFVHFSR